MAAHLLPLGTKIHRLNEIVAHMGMCIFFILSGYLITMAMLHRPVISEFLVRRLCRILPLGWLFLLIVLPLNGVSGSSYLAHFLFYANIPPIRLFTWTGHYWSLCVEVQFYLAVAILVGIAGRRGLLVLPLLGIAISILRGLHGVQASIVTYDRADEILAGVSLALIAAGIILPGAALWINRVPTYWALALLTLCCTVSLGPVNSFRPYVAALVVGSTLKRPLARNLAWLESPRLAYIAWISYGLYIIHPLAMYGWFDPPDKVIKYLRRPLGLAFSFAGAHLSARYYESRWIAWGKRYRATTPPAQSFRNAASG